MKDFTPSKNNEGIDALISRDDRLGRVKVFKEAILTPVAISESGYIAIYQPGGKQAVKTLLWFKHEQVEEKLTIIHASTIVDVDLLVDSKSGLGAAVVGGLMAGGAGAIIGQSMGSKGVKTIDLKIVTNDFDNPQIIVPLHDVSVSTGTLERMVGPGWDKLVRGFKGTANKREKEAQELLGHLDSICATYKSTTGSGIMVNETSDADELAKYKKLLDSGAITQAEFDAKKKQLLGF